VSLRLIDLREAASREYPELGGIPLVPWYGDPGRVLLAVACLYLTVITVIVLLLA
jgi:hypothetical protein